MLAIDMVRMCRWHELIGRYIVTKPLGEWPGGIAKIIEIRPDPAAPEIALQVQSREHGEIGVFDFEEVDFCNEPEARPAFFAFAAETDTLGAPTSLRIVE